MDNQDRETKIFITILKYKQAVIIEELHRWFYDVFTESTTPLPEDVAKAETYKFFAKELPNWRAILHMASELLLPLPAELNLKRYTNSWRNTVFGNTLVHSNT